MVWITILLVLIAATAAVGPAQVKAEVPGLELVPEGIRELFANGISVQEFLEMSAHVPRALENHTQGCAMMIIELEGPTLAEFKVEQKSRGLEMPAVAISMESYRHELEQAQMVVARDLRTLEAQVQTSFTTIYNGFLARIPYRRLSEVRALPGVKAVHPAPEHKPMTSHSVPLMRASEVWTDFGFRGSGMVIAVIDTGIDYTHAALGGSGNPDDYTNNDPDVVEPGSFPTDKVIGGYDFAGTSYRADCTAGDEAAGICTTTPQPDFDPLDENSHGTHVAAIAAGVATASLASGVAPEAKLMALKVFGKTGSTHLTTTALEWAANHFLEHGYPQVINMSLGSNFGTGNDPSVVAANRAANLGMVVVASAGNSGDWSYITGSPGSGSRVISVAASTTGYITGATVTTAGLDPLIYMPGGFAENTGQFKNSLTAPLSYVGNLSGASNNYLCTTSGIPSGALSGRVALIRRGDCPFSSKVNNANSLGAMAALIYNNMDGIMSMSGVPVNIPAGSVAGQDGLLLIEKDGQHVTVSSQNNVSTIPDPYTPADTIASFSSRGPRAVDSFLKPEVTAPGANIFAANMGSGTGGVSKSGTSMAAPHVAGLAALMLEANPDRNPEQVKAALMNTAIDLTDDTPIPRSGAGRVDAFRAVSTQHLLVGDQYLVGLNWGLVRGKGNSLTLEKTVQLFNLSHSSKTFNAGWAFQTGSLTAGADLTVQPSQVTIPAGNFADITVTLTLNLTATPVAYSQILEEYFGFITLGSQETGGGDLRIPVTFLPRPYSRLDISMQSRINVASNTAQFTVSQQGPIPSALSLYPALIHATSRTPGMSGRGDVRLFGMDFRGKDPTHGDIITVALNAWDAWSVPQPHFAEFDLYVDPDRDGTFNYVNFNYNLGWLAGSGDSNLWIVAQRDIATNLIFLGSPYYVYADYNAGYMEWYLPAEGQDLGPTNSDFDYQLVSFDMRVSRIIPKGSFDYVKRPFVFNLSSTSPGPGSPEVSGQVQVYDWDGYKLSKPKGAMLVDFQGDPRGLDGKQAYFLNLRNVPLPGMLMLLME